MRAFGAAAEGPGCHGHELRAKYSLHNHHWVDSVVVVVAGTVPGHVGAKLPSLSTERTSWLKT